jgi:hypothetical protein
LNPSSKVYFLQDNVSLHKLGVRYCQPEVNEYSIKFAPHLPNSPDLHLIERCFRRLEGFLDGYEVASASKEAKSIAEAYVQSIWQDNEEMRQYMHKHMALEYFERVATACIEAEGMNNFTA